MITITIERLSVRFFFEYFFTISNVAILCYCVRSMRTVHCNNATSKSMLTNVRNVLMNNHLFWHHYINWEFSARC